MRRIKLIALLFFFANLFFINSANAQESVSNLKITQVKIGGVIVEPNPQEYLTIINAGSTVADLSNIFIEYLKTPAGGGISLDCGQYPWFNTPITDYSVISIGDSELTSGTQLVIDIGNIPDTRGGSIRIVEEVGESFKIHDTVGWGVANSEPLCKETDFILINNSLALTRAVDHRAVYIDTDNNSNDFVSQLAQPIDYCSNQVGIQLNVPVGYSQDPETGVCTLIPVIDDTVCEGIIITEVLPNPAGSDSGKEFIELYNISNNDLTLKNCSLKTSANSKEFLLDGTVIKKGQFLALYDNITGLTLANASGGSVWLLSNTEEVDYIEYPQDMADDTSFSKFNDGWKVTFTPTPNKANSYLAEKPCPVGQERNPETNRCRNVATNANQLTPCREGQIRNPETNRCRNIASASALTPCKPGQFRNPETNRCKKIDSGSSLVACKPGQERNPETNRCRKIPEILGAASNLASTTDTTAKPLGFNYKVWTALATAVLGYGLFEYRNDARLWVRRLRSNKFSN